MKALTFLGFDYGEKHIGVAVGGTHSQLAQPLTTLNANKGNPDWWQISRLIGEWNPDALVVGLPLNMDGTENRITRGARKFGNRLKDRYNLSVHMVDERLSSRVAKDTLFEAGIPSKRHKQKLDKLAAQTILQAFLNEHEKVPLEHDR